MPRTRQILPTSNKGETPLCCGRLNQIFASVPTSEIAASCGFDRTVVIRDFNGSRTINAERLVRYMRTAATWEDRAALLEAWIADIFGRELAGAVKVGGRPIVQESAGDGIAVWDSLPHDLKDALRTLATEAATDADLMAWIIRTAEMMRPKIAEKIPEKSPGKRVTYRSRR